MQQYNQGSIMALLNGVHCWLGALKESMIDTSSGLQVGT